MKSNIKRLLIFALMLVFALNTVIISADNGDNSVTINEYQLIKNLKSKSDKELKDIGVSDDEIKKIREVDYAKVLKERAKLSDEELKGKGYTDEAIKKLKNFDGTEEQIMALAATCTISLSKARYDYSTSLNKTIMRFGWYWSWTSEPVIMYQDIIGLGWSEGMYFDPNSSVTYAVTQFKRYDNSGIDAYNTSINLDSQTGSASVTFSMKMMSYAWAQSGYGYIQVDKLGKVAEVGVRAVYGHYTLTIGSPSISFPWGIGFTLGTAVSNAAESTVHWYLQ